MHFNQSIVGAALCLSLVAVSQAQTTPEAPAADPAPSTTAAAAPTAPAAAATKGQLPKLVIKWQCKEACTANDKVPPLIEEAYAKAVAKGGYTLSDSETAEVTIVDFRQRPPGVRLGLGFLAGKDRLGVSISYRGKEMTASDYSASTVQGMNSLSESVGKRSYEQIVSIVSSKATPSVN
ncbi:MAG TPA: hypothetical protein VFY73_00975 [Ideonella sp.]|uniref:hypothetical protein n=1 Tax=Ideonella sp. TaxID=1929293 RepID=UPI002E35B603|nr:hypothetical protein [Ideonella sp.]HEX5682578.1 hypothetical protein [Ideonella sp.]